MRLAYLFRSGFCGNTADNPNGGKGLESRKSAMVRARFQEAITTRLFLTSTGASYGGAPIRAGKGRAAIGAVCGNESAGEGGAGSGTGGSG